MSKPENWKDEGSVESLDWSVEVVVASGERGVALARVGFERGGAGGEVYASERTVPSIRAFARALGRAADALEAAAEVS